MYLILKNSINEKMAINVEQISSIRTEFVQKIVLNEDGSSEKSNSYTVIIKTSSSNDEYRLNYCKDTIEEANEKLIRLIELIEEKKAEEESFVLYEDEGGYQDIWTRSNN